MSESGGVWVYAEQHNGHLLEAAFELIAAARVLAARLDVAVSAVLIGHQVTSQAHDLISSGADSVYVADHPSLDQYSSAAYSSILVRLVQAYQPQILLVPATGFGRDLAPTVAARLETGLCADCIALDLDEEGRLLQIAPVLGGKDMATMLCPVRRPQMATLRPGVSTRSSADPDRRGEVIAVKDVLLADQPPVVSLGVVAEKARGKSLSQADVVVAGGAGVGDAHGWRLLGELAQLLGAEIGGTRPPMDDGFLREDQMIGQSGVTIRPRLYVAVGISGDIQHTVGFTSAGVVVAINNDPAAPIFKVADYGILGDYREVVPLLIEALRGV